MGGAVLGGMCFGLVIGTLIGAVLIRASVWLYNKFTGGPESPSAVPSPDFGKACGIALATTGANFVVNLIMGMMMGGAAAAGGASPQGTQIVAQLVSLPVSFFVAAAMLMLLLPTTFGRAMLVALCYILVCIIVVVCIVLIVVAVGFALHSR